MANEEHVERLKRSVAEWNAWREEHPEIRPDLSRANLRGIDLSRIDLSKADLTLADLSRADLSEASFMGAKLRYVHFIDANLTGINLRYAHLFQTILSGAILSQTHFLETNFVRIDLSSVKGLETAIHYGPSYLDLNSVVLPTDENVRKHFLRGVGFSDTFIDYLPSLLTAPIQYVSCFISYAHQDEAIAKRLYTDLRKQDVPCWFAPHDMKIGDEIRSRIDEAIRLHDKLLLILSEHSVASQWVKYEVKTALGKEQGGKPDVLFPVCLDDAVLKSSTGWASDIRLTRHIGDFTNWQDDAAYQEAFSRLLRDLKISKPSTG